MRIGFVLGAMALAASSVAANPAASQPVAAPAKPYSAAHRAAAEDLAEAMAPLAAIDEQVDAMLNQLFDQLYASDPTFVELERDYPGLRAAITDRVRPVMIKSSLQVLPLYRADLAKLYGANLTTQELRDAAAFLRSPEMLAFTASIRRNFKFQRTAASAMADRDATEADVRSDIRSSAGAVASEMTPQQRVKVITFMNSPLGRKLAALNSQKLAINTKWFNHSTPEMEKEIEVAMVSGMVDHIAKTDPAAAKELRAMLNPDGTIPD